MITLPENYLRESDEVFYTTAAVVTAGPVDLDFLKARAAANPRQRARLCAHPAPGDRQHEMLIVHHRDVYVRPHRHLNKSESLLLIEGFATALYFNDTGSVEKTLSLGAAGSGRCFYYRMPAGVFHSLVIESEWLVFHETTAGPFDRTTSAFAPWAPDGNDPAEGRRFLETTIRAATAWLDGAEAMPSLSPRPSP